MREDRKKRSCGAGLSLTCFAKAECDYNLFTRTYLKDVVERHAIQNDTEVLEDLLNIIASAIGSLTNPTKRSNAFDSEKHLKISSATIDK